jgi:hypothetical protein
MDPHNVAHIIYRRPQIERRGRVVNTPASYSGGPGSNIGLETDYPETFRGFPQLFPGKLYNHSLN